MAKRTQVAEPLVKRHIVRDTGYSYAGESEILPGQPKYRREVEWSDGVVTVSHRHGELQQKHLDAIEELAAWWALHVAAKAKENQQQSA